MPEYLVSTDLPHDVRETIRPIKMAPSQEKKRRVRAIFHEMRSMVKMSERILAAGATRKKLIAGPIPAPEIRMPPKTGIMAQEQTVRRGAEEAPIM